MNTHKFYPYIVFFCIIFKFSLGLSSYSNKAFHAYLKSIRQKNVPTIRIKNALKLSNAIFLDTRGKPEYLVSHISNAIHVGYRNFNIASVSNIPKDFVIVTYCSMGARSQKVSKILLKNGYSQVYSLYGGIFLWINENRQLWDGFEVTQSIHPYNTFWGAWLIHGDRTFKPKIDIIESEPPQYKFRVFE